jgi:hypothetical protein
MRKYLIPLFLIATPVFGQTLNITANPAAGIAPVTTTLTWNSTGVSGCFRDTRLVEANGTESISGILATTTFGITCNAGDTWAQLTWLAPTQRTDGSALTNLAGFKIYYGLQGQPLDIVIDIPDPTLTTYRVEPLSEGQWNFAMTAYDSNSLESDKSGTATKSTSIPMSASTTVTVTLGTFVTTETIVYNVVKKSNGFVMIAVGTAPLNTPCDINQTVNGKYAVPVSTVTWLGSVKPVVVVGTCSQK